MKPTLSSDRGVPRPKRSRDGSGRRLPLLVLAGVATAVAASLFAYAAVADDRPSIETGVPSTDPGTQAPTTSTTIADPPTTVAPPTTSVPTTAPPTTMAPEEPPEPSPSAEGSPPADGEAPDHLTVGREGAEVAELQARLIELGYYLPEADGAYGSLTQQAVMAFQKVEGLTRDGVVGPQTREALGDASRPTPRESGDHVEIDLERQIMFVTRHSTTYVFNTSTGRAGRRTPPGRFEVTREIDGMRHAPLGKLWRPKYFNGGIALHGADSIPGHPASAGCARLHNRIIDLIWDQDLAPVGTPVLVYGEVTK